MSTVTNERNHMTVHLTNMSAVSKLHSSHNVDRVKIAHIINFQTKAGATPLGVRLYACFIFFYVLIRYKYSCTSLKCIVKDILSL